MFRTLILLTGLFSTLTLTAQDLPAGTTDLFPEGLPARDSLVADSLDDLPHLRLLTYWDGTKVRLRWAPNSPAAWLLGNHYGYRVERMDLSDPDVANADFTVIADNLRPLDVAGWRAIDAAGQENDYHLVAAEILHGGLLEGLATEGPNVLAAQHFREYHSLALLAADLSPAAAEGLALGFTDRTAQAGKEYLYKVSLMEQSPEFSVREGAYPAQTERPQVFPPPFIEKVEEQEQLITLLLRREQHDRFFTAYNIERSADGGRNWERLNKQPWLHAQSEGLGSEFIIYSDSLAANYRAYQYRFQGISPFGVRSPFSKPVNGMGRDKTPPPPAQDLATISRPGPTIELSWDYDPTLEEELAGFYVGRNDASLGTFTPLHEEPLPPGTRSFVDTEPDPLAVNYYIVAALDTAGNGRPSLVTHSVLIDSLPPAPPTGLAGTIDSTGLVDLSWERGPETDILGYQIYFAHADYHVFAQLTGRPQQVLTYQDTIMIRSLKKDIFYYVVAVDENYNYSAPSDTLRLVKPDVVPPAPPVLTDLGVRPEGVYATWAASSSTDVVAYEWLRRPLGGTEWTVITRWAPLAGPTKLLDNSGKPGQQYEYALRCQDESGYLSEIAFTLRARAPRRLNPVVAQLSAAFAAEERGIVLQWPQTAPTDGRYRIYRAVDGGPFDLMESLPANNLSWTDRQVVAGTQYEYAIRIAGGGAVASDFGRVVMVQF
ncbi:MAG: hypothetical protein AAFZ52_10410 [Bacteroidota bacterium]